MYRGGHWNRKCGYISRLFGIFVSHLIYFVSHLVYFVNHLVYFVSHLVYLTTFLVYCAIIWHTYVSRFGIFYHEKSGKPAHM
jgi:hypothetical protein